MGFLTSPYTSIDRLSRLKINKETKYFNEILDQVNLINIYKVVHLKVAE